MARMVTCDEPGCGQEIKAQGLAIHKRNNHQGDRAAAQGGAARAKTEAPEKNMADDCVDCKFKAKEIEEGKTRELQLQESLNQATSSHDRLGTLIQHAKDGTCVNCKGDLETYTQAVIQTALENVDPAVVQKMAIAKGVLPTSIKVQVPD